MDREFEEPRDEVLRDGAATADPEVLEGLLLVQGHRVRWPAADAFLVQDPDDLVAGDWKGVLATDDVLVVGMDHPVAFGRGREASISWSPFVRARAFARRCFTQPSSFLSCTRPIAAAISVMR